MNSGIMPYLRRSSGSVSWMSSHCERSTFLFMPAPNPIILPPLRSAGFDLIWFGVVMTIVMEMGLIHPPVGLNLFVIKNIAPDIPFRDVLWGTLPFVVIMIVAVVLICAFPGIAMWLPKSLMG